MAKLIRERFSRPAGPFLQRFVASIKEDGRLVTHDIAGSKAHATMLENVGLLTAAEAELIRNGLDAILKEWEAGTFTLDVAQEDVHMNIEGRLTQLIGPVAGKLHTARSRNDQVSLDLRLYVKDAIAEIQDGLAKSCKTLVARALEHAETLLPGITHLQRAQVLVLGHIFLSWREALARDQERFSEALRRTNVSPLGACALAGTSLPIDPVHTASLLGMKPFENSLDAVSDRDFIVEFVSAAAMAMVHLSQISETIILWSTPEFGTIELPDELCAGSSIMPQKKNPDLLELVRAKAGAVDGALMSLLVTLKALPLGYNRDLQETKPPLFTAVDALKGSLEAVRLAIDGLTVNIKAMARAAEDPSLMATDLAEDLVRQGVPFREAHGRIARMVREGLASSSLSPLDSVRAKRSRGGTAPERVRERIQELDS